MPTLVQQVRLAQREGPGYLDYCPLRPGRSPARYDLSLPGLPRAGGWCETRVRREPRRDVVIFLAHWDARRTLRRAGTEIWRFSVNRPASPTATHVALLIGQSGQSLP